MRVFACSLGSCGPTVGHPLGVGLHERRKVMTGIFALLFWFLVQPLFNTIVNIWQLWG